MANVAEYRGIQVPRTWWKLVLTAFGRRFEVIPADAPISDPLLKVARDRWSVRRTGTFDPMRSFEVS